MATTNKKSAAQTTTSATVKATKVRKYTKKEVPAASVKSNINQQPTYESIQRSLMDKDTLQEKSLQQRIKSNLRSLKATIESTQDARDAQLEKREQALQSSSVNWKYIVELDAEIEGSELAIVKLKELREGMFPNWQTILTQD